MALWPDYIDPATLTGYVRAGLEDYERNKGSLAVYLPNRLVPDIVVRFFVGRAGLVDEGRYRAFDAEPEIVKGPGGQRKVIELPAISAKVPVTEYLQLRQRNADPSQVVNSIQNTALMVAQGIADRTERQRGQVLQTGQAVIAQDNYQDTTDFGRNPAMSATAAPLWNDPGSDPIRDIQTMTDLYITENGEAPGSLLMSQRVLTTLAANPAFKTQYADGTSRNGTPSDVRARVEAAGFPPINVYDRRTAGGRVITDDVVLFLPAPGPTSNEAGAPLGSTFWGQTLTGSDPSYGLAPVEQPGIVAGVYRAPTPPMIAEVIADAIALPVLANANLSATLKVL